MTAFTQRNFVADFLQVKYNFRRQMAVLCFWAAEEQRTMFILGSFKSA